MVDINPAMINRPTWFTPLALPLIAALAMLASLVLPAQASAVNVSRLTAPGHICAGQGNPKAKAKKQIRAMRCMINYARARKGLRRLSSSKQLDRSATRKSRDMVRCRSFDHSACGRDFTYWMHRVGYTSRCWSGGENIAWGQYRLGNVRKIFIAWLRSPGHRANMLSRSFNALGVGLRKARFQGYRGAQVWTTHFGKRC